MVDVLEDKTSTAADDFDVKKQNSPAFNLSKSVLPPSSIHTSWVVAVVPSDA